MPKNYGYNAMPVSTGMVYQFGIVPVASAFPSGLQFAPNAFACCGLTAISGFSNLLDLRDFAEKAAWLAALWRTKRGMTHFVYVLSPAQQNNRFAEQFALKECGAKLICKFPNLQPGHGGYDLEMYMCNLNDGIGRFFDSAGTAYATPPKVVTTDELGKTINVVSEDVVKPAVAKAPRPTKVAG